MTYSPGEQWIRLLHGYSPVMENAGMTAEHIGRLEDRTGICRLHFQHPAYDQLRSAILPEAGPPKNVILTGTAGDGKTTLAAQLYRDLHSTEPDRQNEIETIAFCHDGRTVDLTFIWDITAWRAIVDGRLAQDQVGVLEKLAHSVLGNAENQLFVIAVNDGQLHEVLQCLPDPPSLELAKLRKEVLRLHASGIQDSDHRLRLINLSRISSELLMQRCLEAVLDRSEWRCFDEEPSNPIFSASSSVRLNYRLLNTPAIRSRLLMLARLADACGFHMPIRGILCLLVNAILGHPDAKGRVIRPQKGIEQVVAKPAYRAALHRTLFGEHLTPATRHRREVYRFLSLLQVGLETSNDLDELFVFGACDEELKEQYRSIVCADPYSQRNPHFEAMCRTYIRGDLGADEMQLFLQELASERRRLFLTASEDELDQLGLWDTTVFHHAGRYLSELLEPLHQGRAISLDLTRRIVAGLNRIWTGLLLADRADELYLCTGLDRTTATQSDILRQQVDVFGTDGSAVRISLAENSLYPQVEIGCRERVFRFDLTLGRFEFLCRVAEGAMPNTFSREYAEDFSMLKQRCLAKVCPPVRASIINGIRITSSGRIERVPIHLSEGVDG